jgi:hypothetical protein
MDIGHEGKEFMHSKNNASRIEHAGKGALSTAAAGGGAVELAGTFGLIGEGAAAAGGTIATGAGLVLPAFAAGFGIGKGVDWASGKFNHMTSGSDEKISDVVSHGVDRLDNWSGNRISNAAGKAASWLGI